MAGTRGVPPRPDDPPEFGDVRFEVTVRETVGGSSAQERTARPLFDRLAAATSWKLLLLLDDWGEPAAIREPVTAA